MTATRLGKGATLVLAAAAWLVAAYFLWATTVPDDLHLPHVDPHRYWSHATLHRAAHFDGFLRWNFVAVTLAELAVLVVFVFLAPRIANAFDVGRVGKGVLLGTVTTLAAWAVALPFGFASLWWGRRYGLEKESYASWLFEQWPSLLAQVVGLTIVLTVLLLLAGRFPRYWWAIAGPLFTLVAFALIFLLPYVITLDTRAPHKTKLTAEVRALARKEGVGSTPVRVEEVSDQTNAANAMAIGIGPSARVVIWDTLNPPRFTPGEVRVVAAHEFGHVARRHIWKGVAWYALLTIPLFFVLYLATEWRGGMARPEVVPLALLVIAVFNLAVTPFTNVVSRRYEAEADWRALVTTRDPASAVGLFRRFGKLDLEQPDPPGWSYVWIENHPTLVQRIGMAKAWQARNTRR
jgi:Zn-dependent protease with chaperone function